MMEHRRGGWFIDAGSLMCALEWGCCGNPGEGGDCEQECWAGDLVIEQFHRDANGWFSLWCGDKQTEDAIYLDDEDVTGVRWLLANAPVEFHAWIREREAMFERVP